MTTLSLRQLDIFARMVAAGNVARCASDMGVTPQDIRRELASLEMRLGYRLFKEVGGEACLTSAGRKTAQAMTRLSQDGTDSWDEGIDARTVPAEEGRAAAADGVARRTIMLAAPAPIFGHFQDALAAFEAANEDIVITLDLRVQSADDAGRALQRGTADIAYFYALEAPTDFPSRYGWSEQLNLYVGGGHPLAQSDAVTRDDLTDVPMLAMEGRNGMRRVIDEALVRGGVRAGPPMVETDNMFEIMTALRKGEGCFAAFGAMASDLGRMAGLRRMALDMPLPAIEVRQAVSPRAAQTLAVEALAEFLFL